ncbi:MAG: hypothetical protein Kow0059_10770 [Candidatus Sumerlaeia bacterium]
MDFPLDLEGAIRPGLDITGNEIIIALKKRTRFKQNLEIYRPGLVVGQPGRSLLDYELNRIECVHAELGRYTYASQEPYTDISRAALIIERDPPPSPVIPFTSNMGPRILERYISWITEGCSPGSNSDTWGESVTADVAALLSIQERINIGKYVAEFKFQKAPDSFYAARNDPEALRALVVNREREMEVIQGARQLAAHYSFDPDQAVRWFEWMIARTVEVEVAYLTRRLDQTERLPS